MDLVDAINSRRSIRGYKPDPVEKELIMEILEIATRAPSSMNSQPWEITVVTGETLDRIKEGNIQQLTAGQGPNPEIKMEAFQGVYRDRQVGLAKQLFGLMDISREDKAKRMQWTMQGFKFFDAPAAVFFGMSNSLDPAHSYTDLGAFIQTFCLAATERGLGTCIMGQGVMFPEVVREHTKIPETCRLFLSTPLGYPDPDYPANKLHTPRVPIEDNTTFIGF